MFNLKMMHRDISYRNILLGQYKELENKVFEFLGVLIDFDFAVKLREGKGEALARLTVCLEIFHTRSKLTKRQGTLPFMALDILNNVEGLSNRYHHDLESLFYVLIWIVTTLSGPFGKKREDMRYRQLNVAVWNGSRGLDPAIIYGVKYSQMISEDNFKKLIIPQIHSFFKPLIPCIERLREIMFPVTPNLQKTLDRIDEVRDWMSDSSISPETKAKYQKMIINLNQDLPLHLREDGEIFKEFIDILRRTLEHALTKQDKIPQQRPEEPVESAPAFRPKRGGALKRNAKTKGPASSITGSKKRTAEKHVDEPASKKIQIYQSKSEVRQLSLPTPRSNDPAAPSSAQEGGRRLALYSPAPRTLGTPSLMSDGEDDESIRPLSLATHSRHTPSTPSAQSLGGHEDDGIEADLFGPHIEGVDKETI